MLSTTTLFTGAPHFKSIAKHHRHAHYNLEKVLNEAIDNIINHVFNENNLACNKDGEPYYIFHQWDRTEAAQKILEKQYSGLKFSL